MDVSPNLALPFLLPNQAQKHVTLNEALRALDALTQIGIASRSQGVPLPAPTEGESYLIASGASGDWQGEDGQLAAYQDGAWAFHTPKSGWLAWVADEQTLIIFDGTSWQDASSSGAGSVNPAPLVGVNATADTTNRLSVKSPASLFDHEGAGHQLKVNKAADTDTASLLFQSAYSGHAEMGLIGDNSFVIKTSADGSSFSDAMKVDMANGYIGIGTTAPASRLQVTQASDARLTIETTNPGTGGGFDVINSADNQSWRVTGSKFKFKFRDHSAALDKFVLEPGAAGNGYIINSVNFGIGTNVPSAKLHVAGPVRIGQYSKSALPNAASTGSGALIHVSDDAGGAVIALSDGSNWRRVTDRAIIT